MLPAVFFLMGPTSTGKSSLAIKLANQYNLEIISVDSSMVYRGMDIGTAKPGPEVLSTTRHRLIDIRYPSETYNAADFCRDAEGEIEESLAIGKTPLLVGGTNLYFRRFEQGIAKLPSANQGVRESLLSLARETSWRNMHQKLQDIDNYSASRIHPNDPQRIMRALEVYEITGKPMSEIIKESSSPTRKFQIHKIILTTDDRSELSRRIENRFHQMLSQGLLDEVDRLMSDDSFNREQPSMRAVGYREAILYLENGLSYNDMIEKAVTSTRQYAKRQFTWLRKETGGSYFDCMSSDLFHETSRFIESVMKSSNEFSGKYGV